MAEGPAAPAPMLMFYRPTCLDCVSPSLKGATWSPYPAKYPWESTGNAQWGRTKCHIESNISFWSTGREPHNCSSYGIRDLLQKKQKRNLEFHFSRIRSIPLGRLIFFSWNTYQLLRSLFPSFLHRWSLLGRLLPGSFIEFPPQVRSDLSGTNQSCTQEEDVWDSKNKVQTVDVCTAQTTDFENKRPHPPTHWILLCLHVYLFAKLMMPPDIVWCHCSADCEDES